MVYSLLINTDCSRTRAAVPQRVNTPASALTPPGFMLLQKKKQKTRPGLWSSGASLLPLPTLHSCDKASAPTVGVRKAQWSARHTSTLPHTAALGWFCDGLPLAHVWPFASLVRKCNSPTTAPSCLSTLLSIHLTETQYSPGKVSARTGFTEEKRLARKT